MIDEKRMLRTQLRDIEVSYKSVVEANVKLMDEKKWAFDDRDRALRRISEAVDYIKSVKEIDKDELLEILRDYYE